MKDLKYIKLFEAFESSKLSSILSFVKDKNKFIALLKKICDTIDYPYSKLSDEFFEYLPFKKALYRNIKKTKEKCDAESDTVPGEFCKNGMIKRTWGKGYRFKECDVCHGTGIKPEKTKDSVKLIKFWFDVNGEFVQTTGSDGEVRNATFSDNISDYEKVKVISKADYIHGRIDCSDIILMKIDGIDVVGYFYINSYGNRFLLQNKKDGSAPGGADWKKVARFSWALSSSDFSYNNVYLLKLKDTEVKKDIDPYSFNGLLNIGYNGLSISNNAAYDTKSIKNADFALILDVDKLKTSKFNNINTIKNDREVSRKGSLFLKKDDIKRENIKRYLDKISNSSNVKGTIEDLNNCNKMVNRILGGKNMLYFIHPDSNESSKSRLDSIVTKMFHMFKSLNSGNMDEVNSYVGGINYSLPSYIRNVADVNVNINSTIDEIDKSLDTEYKEIFELIKKLGDTIYKHISNYKIETLDDIEMILQEIVFISSLLYTGRYPNLRKLNRFFYRITNSSAKNVYDALVSGLNSTSIDDIKTEINTIIRLIKKHEMIR